MLRFVVQKKAMLAICILALALRIPLLNGSLWLDEAAQAMESSRPLSQQTSIADDYQPPLFHIIIHFFVLVSKQEWWIRLPSLIAGIGTVAILFVLVEEKVGKKTAIAASILLATSPFHVFYSQELRPYSIATFFAILSWYILLTPRVKKRRWFLYTIVTTLGMYSMYLIPFNILAQLMYVFFENRKSMKSICFSLCAVGLIFLPWLPLFLKQLRVGTALTTQLPGWAQAVATPQLKVIPLTLAKFIVGQVTFHDNLVITLLTGIFLALASAFVFMKRKEKSTRAFLYWFLIPLLAAWLVSFLVPVIQPKRVLFILPAVYALITASSKKMLIGSLITFQVICLFLYWTTPAIQRENWRDLISTIQTSAPTQSAALFAFPAPFAPWQWYSAGTVSTISTGRLRIDDALQTASVSSQLQSVSQIYLFDYLRDLTDPHRVLEKTLADSGFSSSEKIDAKAIGFVRIFARMK